MNDFLSNIFERNFFEHSVWFYIAGGAMALVLGSLFYQVLLKASIGREDVSSVAVTENKLIVTGLIYNSGGRYGSTFYHTRISLYDIETGKRIKRKILHRDRYSIEMIVNGIVWLEPDDGKARIKDNRKVLAIDFTSLEKLVGEKKLKELLKISDEEEVDVRLEGWDGKVRVKAKGQKYFFDCNQLSSPNGKPGQTYPYKGGHGEFRFERMDDLDIYQLQYDDVIMNPESKYYDPTMLAAWDDGHSNAKAIGYHFEDNDSRTNFLITLFDRSGKSLWTISRKELGLSEKDEKRLYPKFIGMYNDFLIFRVTRSKGGKIFSLSKSTGKLIWQKKG